VVVTSDRAVVAQLEVSREDTTPSPLQKTHVWLRAMIAHFKPKNVIELGSGFSSACMLDAVDHVGLSDFG
jgi:predicted O-methyltransferase YrrM